MKKVLLAVLLMLSMAAMPYAQDSANEDKTADEKEKKGSFGGCLRIGYSFPIFGAMIDTYNESEGEGGATGYKQVTLAFAFSSVAVGGGLHYTIVPHLLAPGFYVDMQFNLFGCAITGLLKKEFILFQGGIRLYNQFGFKFINIEPFFGFNYMYLRLENLKMGLPLLTGGCVFNIARFSLEYGYHFYPKKLSDGRRLPGFQHFTLSWILLRK